MPAFRIDEVVAARDAARGFSGLTERLRSGTATRFVIVFRNRPQAVLLHIAEYERLLLASAGPIDETRAA